MKRKIGWSGFMFLIYLVALVVVGVITLGRFGPF